MDKLTQIATLSYNMVRNAPSAVEEKVMARAIGTMIFDIPTTRSGMVSVALIDEYGYRPSISKCTLEHFHSRNESGYTIINLVNNLCELEEVIAYLREATMVHLTTKDENIRLSSIQNHPMTKDLSWSEQYDLAGIELVEDPGTMPIKMRNQLKKDGKI